MQGVVALHFQKHPVEKGKVVPLQVVQLLVGWCWQLLPLTQQHQIAVAAVL